MLRNFLFRVFESDNARFQMIDYVMSSSSRSKYQTKYFTNIIDLFDFYFDSFRFVRDELPYVLVKI